MIGKELFERNHDLVNVLHYYGYLTQSKQNNEDFEDQLEKFIRNDLVKKYFNFEDSHDAMNLGYLYLISEGCVDNQNLENRLLEWTWENEVHLTDETKSLFSTVNHATMSEIESKFESIKNDLYHLNDTLEMAKHRDQENELIDRNDGKTDDPFDEVELRGRIYEMDLDEISDYEKFRLIEDLEFYSGPNSERWQDSKLKNIIGLFN